jgi:beta-carotene hydroxylase
LLAAAHLLTEPTFSWWALGGIALCTYAIYTPLHEAVHGAVTGMSLERRWVNEWTGYIAAHFIGISFTSHRRSHLKHHRSTNHPSEDPDMVLSADNAYQLVIAWLKGVPKEWLFAASFEHFTDAEKVAVRREFIAIILTRLMVLFFCADFGVTLLTLLVGQLIGNAVLVTLFAWSVHHPHTEQERMQTTTIYQARTGARYGDDTVVGLSKLSCDPSSLPQSAFFPLSTVIQGRSSPYLVSSGVPVKQLV